MFLCEEENNVLEDKYFLKQCLVFSAVVNKSKEEEGVGGGACLPFTGLAVFHPKTKSISVTRRGVIRRCLHGDACPWPHLWLAGGLLEVIPVHLSCGFPSMEVCHSVLRAGEKAVGGSLRPVPGAS